MTQLLQLLGWLHGGRLILVAALVLGVAWLRVLLAYRTGHVCAPLRWYMSSAPAIVPPETDSLDLRALRSVYDPKTGAPRPARPRRRSLGCP